MDINFILVLLNHVVVCGAYCVVDVPLNKAICAEIFNFIFFLENV
jgi:hypothetical protein